MSLPATLIHLVSHQTMQNLLPLVALQPRRVVQVRSDDARFDSAVERLPRAVGCVPGLHPPAEFKEARIPEVSPSMEGTRQTMAKVLKQSPGAILNLTGGTKPMSIGAFLAAQEAGAPVLYCDTQSGSFHSLNPNAELPGLSAFHDAARILTVEAVLAAHGCQPDNITSVIPGEPELEFGRTIGILQNQNPEGMAKLAGRLHQQLYPGNRRIPKSQIDAILAEGLPLPENDQERAFFDAARTLGCMVRRGDRDYYQLPDDATNPEKRIRAALKILKTLTGGWFEFLVYDKMRATGRFGDLRMEVQSRGKDPATRAIGENDLMGIDLERLGLVFVSCKVSDAYLQKPLEHCFATHQRSMEFGGAFAQTLFCFHHFTDPNKERIIRDACRTLGARLLIASSEFA